MLEFLEAAIAPGSQVDRLIALLDDQNSSPEVKKLILKEQQGDPQVGPMILLICTMCLEQIESKTKSGGLKQLAAREGLKRMNADSFRKDVKLLFSEESPLRDCATEFIQFVRQMTPDEVEIVSEVLDAITRASLPEESPSRLAEIRVIFAFLRTAEVTEEQAIEYLARVAWDEFFQGWLQKELTEKSRGAAGSVLSSAATTKPVEKDKKPGKPDFIREASASGIRAGLTQGNLLDAIKPFDASEPIVSPSDSPDKISILKPRPD